MSKLDTFVCDGEGCTQQKNITNHWFVCYATQEAITICTWIAPETEGTYHFCGIACLNKWVAKQASKLGANNAKT